MVFMYGSYVGSIPAAVGRGFPLSRCGYGTQRKHHRHQNSTGFLMFLYIFFNFPNTSILLTNLPFISNRLYPRPQDSFLRHKLFTDEVSKSVFAEGCNSP